jgi:hypothetical protein
MNIGYSRRPGLATARAFIPNIGRFVNDWSHSGRLPRSSRALCGRVGLPADNLNEEASRPSQRPTTNDAFYQRPAHNFHSHIVAHCDI